MNGYLLVLLCSIYFSVCTDSMDRQYSIVFLPYGNRQYAVQFQESLSGREDRICEMLAGKQGDPHKNIVKKLDEQATPTKR